MESKMKGNSKRNGRKGPQFYVVIFLLAIFVIVVIVSLSFAIYKGMSVDTSNIEITWSAFNTSIAILEIYIVLFSIVIGVAAFYGFRTIKDNAEEVARKEAKNKITKDLPIIVATIFAEQQKDAIDSQKPDIGDIKDAIDEEGN